MSTKKQAPSTLKKELLYPKALFDPKLHKPAQKTPAQELKADKLPAFSPIHFPPSALDHSKGVQISNPCNMPAEIIFFLHYH